jgi:hypothetical protein
MKELLTQEWTNAGDIPEMTLGTIVVNDSEGNQVAVLGYSHSCDDQEESEHFNSAMKTAYLIAKAPAMYRMLADISKSIDHCGDEVDVDFMKVSIDKLLAEARGESKDTD